ncbi:hypothetical protein H9L10_02140 [Phycicoccus endophyticus]|uniref:EpsG family protein n=1 Tax=Phycicoccus endophyticus TaxID=1690220 RepID=A0A7G9R2T5_9MICO|nr:hypothetical protein [Phycicoccus endophyticus]NHI20378.1 hypothetical protein [Phycicoccus endophyticus]QNN49910.1 hypothetical protein H9L10_02140 [Phycicoccus endophyticus]GGL29685.1 hypothetical protein GCM10012283_10090 [Phycicoccus endophyticus]
MIDDVSLAWFGLHAVTFVALTLHKRTNAWALLAAVFVVLSVGIRLSIPVDAVRDFSPYYAAFQQVQVGSIPRELFFEPYRLVLFQAILMLDGLDSHQQIALIYYLHFIVVTGFFLWLAYLTNVSPQVKVVLFLTFYPVMALVWIQAGAAYVAACFLFLVVGNRSKFGLTHYLLPLFHASLAPLVVAMKVKDLRPIGKVLAVGVMAIVGYFALESSYAQYIVGTLSYYAQTADQRTSDSFLLLYVASILTYLVLAAISIDFRKNFPILVLMGVYVGAYQINPVVGTRLFPLVLIACIAQRIDIPRRVPVTLLLALVYVPVYFVRFHQVLSGV